MASLSNEINDLSGADESAAQTKERLELLKNAAIANLKLAEDSIAEDLSGNGGGVHKLFIVPDTVMDFQQGYTISSGETMDEGLSTAIDQFFSGDTKDGFKTVVKSGLSALFADTTAGETEKRYYFVAMEHNAFIRVDLSVWKYFSVRKVFRIMCSKPFVILFVNLLLTIRRCRKIH